MQGGLQVSNLHVIPYIVFTFSDMNDLENRLQDAVISGQPRTHRPWKKIMIIVEGVYRYAALWFFFMQALAMARHCFPLFLAYLYVCTVGSHFN